MARSRSTLCLFLLLFQVMTVVLLPQAGMTQEEEGELTKRVKTRVQPIYPELARRMKIKGTVKLMVTIGPDGKVVTTKVLGGHPLLVAASADALRRWKFAPAAQESKGTVVFAFLPTSE
jgi:TonB family protein